MTETAPWLILACALFNLGFGVFHLLFWRLLGWPASLAPAGGLNRAVTQTLNLMLCYCFFAVALALVLAGDGAVGRGLALFGAGFWLLRAVLQPVFFPMRRRYSAVLLAVFVAGVALHGAAGLGLDP